jgi:hypothetical protein
LPKAKLFNRISKGRAIIHIYFLKNWGRGIQSFFTFNPIRKAELRMKFANEKLMEAKKLVELKKDSEIIAKATENYQDEVEKIKERVEKIEEKAKENPQVESFLDKFVQQQILHQKLLQKLENQVPPQAFEKIKEAREEHLERFKDVMLKLEDRTEKITEKLDKTLKEQKGSEFKEFKNLEILKNLEEKVPEQAKEAIQKAQENALKRLKGDLEKMSPENQERFKEYLEKISGDKEKQLEVLENVKAKFKELPRKEIPGVTCQIDADCPESEVKEMYSKCIDGKCFLMGTPVLTPLILERIEEGKTKLLEEIEKRLEKLDCPLWSPPAPGFCKEGRVIMGKDPQTGCPLPPKCIILVEVEIPEKPEKPTVCPTLWAPVCGKDGKTYSNSCFAEIAKVEIDYKGVCKVPPSTGITPKPGVCIQVIAPAISPDGICKEFRTPCDVPEGWKEVAECPSSIKTPTY